jgi:N-acylneuraminate cytidylyltransferase/CMP-N,N'-diacetyllegionaminic acid synthase
VSAGASRLCTICARGGSKGVPGKNIRPLAGKPLIAHSIAVAKESGLFGLVAVSSDSQAILDAALAWGADLAIRRPDDLATDTAGKLPAIQHAVAESESRSGRRFDILVDLDATSPLRLPEDIVGALALMDAPGTGNVITGAPAHRSPYFNLVEADETGAVRPAKPLPRAVLRRQDAPVCYDMNASIYVWRHDRFMREPYVFDVGTRLYAMPPERSLDIDDELDFAIVEFLMQRRGVLT